MQLVVKLGELVVVHPSTIPANGCCRGDVPVNSS
jgi:hypothetical protein